jgi:hypothetical protein
MKRIPSLMAAIALPVLFGGAIILTSCIKQESYPIVPEIGYQGMQLYFDSSSPYAKIGVLTISFQDGDGDIGLNPRDTIPPYNFGGQYYYNYVIRYFEKRDTGFTEVVLNPPYSTRIPVLNPNYPGKPIKGLIADTLVLDPTPAYDTVRLEVFIYDRALHQSNVITTPDIILRKPH